MQSRQKLFTDWKNHLKELNSKADILRASTTIQPPEATFLQNTHEATWIVENNLFVPKARSFGYNYNPIERTVRKPFYDTIQLAEPLERPDCQSYSAIVVLGQPASGKSSLIHGYFHSTMKSEEIFHKKLNPKVHTSQVMVCANGCHRAVGKYNVGMRGLDSITDKGAESVQRAIVDAWYDIKAKVILLEGIHAAYLSIHRMMRDLQSRFFRKLYVVFLDAQLETLKQRVHARAGGLMYTRKSIVEAITDESVIVKQARTASKTWENLKIIHKDDDELFLGYRSYNPLVPSELSSGFNSDGSLKRSRYMGLIRTDGLSQEEVLVKTLSFVGYPTCNSLK